MGQLKYFHVRFVGGDWILIRALSEQAAAIEYAGMNDSQGLTCICEGPGNEYKLEIMDSEKAIINVWNVQGRIIEKTEYTATWEGDRPIDMRSQPIG